MSKLPEVLDSISWFEGELVTIDFDRTVDFDPKKYPELIQMGQWIISDDQSKYYLIHKMDKKYPDKTINKVLGDLNLNGYELIHSYTTYA